MGNLVWGSKEGPSLPPTMIRKQKEDSSCTGRRSENTCSRVEALRKKESSHFIAGLWWDLRLHTLACSLPDLFYTQTLSISAHLFCWVTERLASFFLLRTYLIHTYYSLAWSLVLQIRSSSFSTVFWSEPIRVFLRKCRISHRWRSYLIINANLVHLWL